MVATKHADRSMSALDSPTVSEHKLVASVCRESFFEFVREFWHEVVPDAPVWNWHIEYLCDEIQKVCERIFRGEDRVHDVCCNIPPGTSKSSIFSIFACAWAWTRFPGFRFIGASYGLDLQQELSRKCRALVESDKYRACFPDVVILADQNTKSHFATTAGGFRLGVGSGGRVTGYHAHLIVVDDPINPEQAASPADTMVINRWIRATLSTRMVNKRVSVMMMVMQRLGMDDPTAEFLRRENVKHICYDADTEILTRRGWVKFPDLKSGEEVAQVDPDGLAMSFTVPTLYVDKRYSGRVLRTQTDRVDMLVTPDHRMIVKKPHTHKDYPERPWEVVKAKAWTEEDNGRLGWVIPQSVVWNAPCVESVYYGGFLWDGDDFARFMGIWSAEGSVLAKGYPGRKGHGNNVFNITVVQKAGRTADRIWKLLQRLPVEFKRYELSNGMIQFSVGGVKAAELAIEMAKMGGSRTKYVPDEIKKMSARQIRKFLSWQAAGDGHRLPKGNVTFTTVSKRLADDLQELILMTGRTANVRYDEPNDCYRIHERRSTNGRFDTVGRVSGEGTRWEEYDGRVYCVGVPTGALLVRRNGKPFVSGNCLPAEVSDLVMPENLKFRYRDGLLDPVRMTRKVLRAEEKNMGQFAYSSQFRQQPVPPGGGMFKADKLTIITAVPASDHVVRRIRFWDKAGTSGKGAFTVGVRMAVTKFDRYIVEDVIRGQWDSYVRESVIKRTAEVDGRGCEVGLEQEPGSGGKESAESTVRMLAGYKVKVIRVDTSKVDRADTFSVQVNGGNVYLMAGEWNAAFIEEVKHFPWAKFKDQIDGSSGAFGVLLVPKRRVGGLR